MPLNFLKSLYQLIVNGQRFPVDSTDIRITNINSNGDVVGGVYAGGKLVTSGLQGVIKVEFEGGLAKLDCNVATVNGDITGPVDANTLTVHGNVTSDKIDSNTVKADGDITARKIDANTVKGTRIVKIP